MFSASVHNTAALINPDYCCRGGHCVWLNGSIYGQLAASLSVGIGLICKGLISCEIHDKSIVVKKDTE